MRTLLLLLSAPLQSWGSRSQSPRLRDTAMHPTRSGLIGLLAACQGMDRTVEPSWAEPLRIHVRIDAPGLIVGDFHTTGGGYRGQKRLRSGDGGYRDDAVVSRRHYLSDATFVAAIQGPEPLIDSLAAAVSNPVFVPFLGRKSCPPALPIALGTADGPGLDHLGALPAYGPLPRRPHQRVAPIHAETVSFDALEASSMAEPRTTCRVIEDAVDPQYASAALDDVPLSFNHWGRRYGRRLIGELAVTVPRAGVGADALRRMRSYLELQAPSPGRPA